jgi:hypothetical protein
MGLPVAKSGRIQRACLNLRAWENRALVKHFLTPLLTSFLPGALVFAAAKPESLQFVQSLKISKWQRTPLGLGLGALVCAFLFTVCLKYIWELICTTADSQRKFSREDLNLVLTAFDKIVSLKLNRFCKVYWEIKNGKTFKGQKSLSQAKIFSEITKPDEQIDAIIVGLQGVLENLYPTASFRCALLQLDDDEKPLKWISSVGGTPRTSPDTLCNPNSTAMCAIRNRCTVVVENLQHELAKVPSAQRFIAGRPGSTVCGSQLCFPVLDVRSQRAIYVVSVSGSVAGSIQEAHTDLLQWVIGHFSQRILLEHYLVNLRS